MSNLVVDTLTEMGFSKDKAELAVSILKTTDLSAVMDWILSHDEELEAQLAQKAAAAASSIVNEQPSEAAAAVTTAAAAVTTATETVAQVQPPSEENSDNKIDEQSVGEATTNVIAKSLKCDDCGKLFKNQDEVNFHAAKSDHTNFSESTEEKKPLTEDEKKERLAKIEEKLKQRRQEREAREKEEALERERNRIRSGKEILEAKKKYDEIEMKKIVEQRKREKEEERLAKERVRQQIEQDKLARKAKFSGQPMDVVTASPPQTTQLVQQNSVPKKQESYSEVVLQIRLTNGTQLVQKFSAKEPLSAVKLYVEMNRKDGDGPFSLMTPFPRKIFGPEDYDVPLDSLGLGPRATLIVSKT